MKKRKRKVTKNCFPIEYRVKTVKRAITDKYVFTLFDRLIIYCIFNSDLWQVLVLLYIIKFTSKYLDYKNNSQIQAKRT